MYDTFEVNMLDGKPVVNEDGIIAYTEMLTDVSTAQARWFGNCMYFICALTHEITKVKYAVFEDGEFVSAAFLRKMERRRAKEKLKAAKLAAKREKREAKSREERRSIQEKFERVKELLKVRVHNSKYTGMGEEFKTERKPGVPFRTDAEIINSVNERLEERQRNNPISERIGEITSKLSKLDVTQFFDQTKFKEYLQTPHGQASLAKYRES